MKKKFNAQKFVIKNLDIKKLSKSIDNYKSNLDNLKNGKNIINMLNNITVNKNAIPHDTLKPTVTSGLRLGTAAITTRGLKEKEMDEVAEF